MKITKINLIVIVIAFCTSPISVFAGGGNSAFDICIDDAVDFAFVDGGAEGPTPGDPITAVGGIWPSGSIEIVDAETGETSAGFNCENLLPEERIGTFYSNGHLVRSLVDFSGFPVLGDLNENPAIAMVLWHFTIDGVGELETAGPVLAVAPGDSYPQIVIGGTGRYKSTKGAANTTVLNLAGFQFNMEISNSNNK
ncbi:MAG: hypothetical protein JKX92_14585 [Porticoccaceae bacterium]|nr:hypothetical protein [Porticoccaceae bacterium]